MVWIKTRISRASRTRSVLIEDETRQPVMQTNPAQVAT